MPRLQHSQQSSRQVFADFGRLPRFIPTLRPGGDVIALANRQD